MKKFLLTAAVMAMLTSVSGVCVFAADASSDDTAVTSEAKKPKHEKKQLTDEEKAERKAKWDALTDEEKQAALEQKKQHKPEKKAQTAEKKAEKGKRPAAKTAKTAETEQTA